MANKIYSAPFFTLEACKGLIIGNDSLRKKEGRYGELQGDYQRTAFLILNCFSLVMDQVQKWGQYQWGQVVNFSKLSDTISQVSDYWELVDFLQASSRLFFLIRPVVVKLDITVLCKKTDLWKLVSEVSVLACKSLASSVALLSRMDDIGFLKGVDVYKWELIGCVAGIFSSVYELHENLVASPIHAEEFKKDCQQLKKGAQKSYREQKSSRAFWDTIGAGAALAMSIVGFCKSLQAFAGARGVVKFIADHHDQLFLGSFVMSTSGIIITHLYEQQMRVFKQLNKAN